MQLRQLVGGQYRPPLDGSREVLQARGYSSLQPCYEKGFLSRLLSCLSCLVLGRLFEFRSLGTVSLGAPKNVSPFWDCVGLIV